MGKDMVNTESNPEADHFIMLDVLDTVSRKEFDRSYPYVQILDPSDMNSYHDNQPAESHPETGLTQKERKNISSQFRSILRLIIN